MKAKIISIPYKGAYDLKDNIPLPVPYVIYIEPSGFCNFKCKFCPQYTGSGMKKDTMKLELFEKIIFDLKQFDKKIKLVRICGQGEPLLNKNLDAFLKLLYESNVAEKIELVTNGFLLTDELVDCISRYVTRIIISLEALNDEDYKFVTNTDVKFSTILHNIKTMYCNKKNCIIHVKILYVKDEKDKEQFFDLFGNISDEIFIEQIVQQFPNAYINELPVNNITRWGKDVLPHKICVQIFKSIQICANGNVVACCVDWEQVNLLGNVHTESVKDIWNGSKLKQLQNIHLSGNINYPCINCKMNDYCEGDNIDSLIGKRL
jgi:radical SAM protein with 4Fe4S-binding SPASM domain